MTNQTSLTQTVRNFITDHRISQTESHILTALSGGADSVCLLCALKELQQELGITVSAMHVHHGIRGQEADRDVAFCLQLCDLLDVPCHVVYVDVPAMAASQKLSLEEAARMARYQALEEQRQRLLMEYGGEEKAKVYVAVAHHREDQAETVVWNLLRGSGLKGLGGMEPIRGSVIRPLLDVSKEEILSYLSQHQILWQQDSTNNSDDYTRNRIRHHMLGYASEHINPRASEHICQAARLAGQADAYLRKQAVRWLDKELSGEEPGSLRVSRLLQEDEILQGYILRELLSRCRGLVDVTARHVEAMQDLLTETAGGSAQRRIDLGDGLMICRSYDRLWLSSAQEAYAEMDLEPVEVDISTLLQEVQAWKEGQLPEEGFFREIRVGEHIFTLRLLLREKLQEIPTNQYTKWINYDTLDKVLVFRSRQTGDYIMLPHGKRKTVKSYMIDEKIPVGERDRIPMVAQGNHVLWIAGHRLSEGAKITEDTRWVLEIQMYGG